MTDHKQRAVQSLSERHEAMLDYMTAHPEATQGQVARAFGMTPGWVSQLVNTDLFREAMKARRQECVSRVTVPLEAKIAAVAHVALDRMAERLEDCDDIGALQSAAEKALDRLGIGVQRQPEALPGMTIIGTVNVETLNRARENFAAGARQPITIDQQGEPVESTTKQAQSATPASYEV